MGEEDGDSVSSPDRGKLTTSLEQSRRAVDIILEALDQKDAFPQLVPLAAAFAETLQKYPTVTPYLFDEETGRPLGYSEILKTHTERLARKVKSPEFVNENEAKRVQAEKLIGLIDQGQKRLARLRGKSQGNLTETERNTAIAFAETEAIQQAASQQVLTGKLHTDEQMKWAKSIVIVCVPNILQGRRLALSLKDYTLPVL